MVELSKMAFAITFVVRGYHVYKDIWAAEIGSELPCFTEPHNRGDRYAVAVMDSTSIVGHVPRKISYICYIFLLHSGSIICRVTGPRQYSQDLEQGGVDVPCEYRFFSKDERVKVTRKLLELASIPTKDIAGMEATPSTNSKDTTESHAGIEVSSTCSATSHLTHHLTTGSNTSSATSCSTTRSTTTFVELPHKRRLRTP